MDDFLAKPVDEALLRQAIERYTTLGQPQDHKPR
jgi:CheY-like chemotaxis protein